MNDVKSAAEAVRRVFEAGSTLLVTAGAGMGTDSGLPDFRGDEGFWNEYPPFRHLGLSFVDLANPRWFRSDPHLAWGFYGHRLDMYRRVVPHRGFDVVRRWCERASSHFVFTSNVDGHFQRAGFTADHVLECHGSIHHMQCAFNCGEPVFAADGVSVTVDAASMRAQPPLPVCPRCREVARPNILMFGDAEWDASRYTVVEKRLASMLEHGSMVQTVVLELGAGTHVPAVRGFGERLAYRGATLVRINVREPEIPSADPRRGHVGLAARALDALVEIDRLIAQ
jgi:NAD-dependent SIR2 family protein deacetylase